jgi:4-aminobutyrate--pyruvate transaminase
MLPANHLDFDLPFTWVRHLTCPHHYREALAAHPLGARRRADRRAGDRCG